jgi:hypothetical protein
MASKRGISDDSSQPSPKRMKEMPIVHVRPSTPASLDINSGDEAGSLKPQPTNTNGNETESPETQQITKKERRNPKITTAEFAAIDDMLTGVLIDGVDYWTKIRKNESYTPPRGLEMVEITAKKQSRNCQDHPEKRHRQVRHGHCRDSIALDRRDPEIYLALEAPTRKHFRDHLLRYLQIYLTDCPFDINSTHRYDLSREEASITARHCIPQGSTIKYLNGAQVDIPSEEEGSIMGEGSHFSIVYSSRRKRHCIFLGPARFVNHDCDTNAKLAPEGRGIRITATRNINAGEEITASYAADYFGKGNSECLCVTCEHTGTNGWAMNGRQPGDYKTASCKVCLKTIVQLGEPECPRCKRHRTLYGHTWPARKPNDESILQEMGPNTARRRSKSIWQRNR